MTTRVQVSKAGIKLVCDVSDVPVPRPKLVFPIPDFGGASYPFVILSLDNVVDGRRGIIATVASKLPGSASDTWTLGWMISGAAIFNECTVVAGGVVNVPNAMASVTYAFRLSRTTAEGNVTRYPLATITTPSTYALVDMGDIAGIQNAVDAMASDSILSVGEKPTYIAFYTGFKSQVDALRAKATAISATLPTQNTLLTYLNTLTPYAWNDTATGHDTNIPDPAVWTSKWAEIQAEISALNANIATKLASDTSGKLPIGGTSANASQLLGYTWAIPGAIGSTTPNTIAGTIGTFTELTAARSGAITRINIYSDTGYGSSLYSYINGQPRTVLSTDATNWSIGTWTAAGVLNDYPIIIPIAGGAISINRGITMAGAMSFTASTSGIQPGTITYNASCGLGLWAKTGGSYDLTVWNAAGNIAWYMPAGTSDLTVVGAIAGKARNTASGRAMSGNMMGAVYAGGATGTLGALDYPGAVRIGDASSYTDMPNNGGGGYGNLLNVHGGSDTMAQVYFNYESNRMMFRCGHYTGGAWQYNHGGVNGWAEVYTTQNIDTAPASVQAVKALVNAPQVGTLASRPAASSYPGGYYFATDAVAPDGLLGALYHSDGTSWGSALNPITIAGRIVVGSLSAGSAGVTSMAAQMTMSGTIQSLPFTAGSSGFKFSGNAYTTTLWNGSTASVRGELNGDMAIAGYLLNGLALAKIAGSGGIIFPPGTHTWVCPPNITEVTLILIGGGASGGSNSGGHGGGAGGALKARVPVTPLQSYTIVVGAGGASVANAGGIDGGASTGLGFTAYGGLGSGAGGGITGPYGSLSGAPATGPTSSSAKASLMYLFACAGCAGGPLSDLSAGSTDFYEGGGICGGGASAAGSGGVQATRGVTEAMPGTGYGAGGGYAQYPGWSSGAGAPGYARIDY